MTPEQFCYWLQGRAEMQPDTPPSKAEWKMIREHLATVFHKVTPPLQPLDVIPRDWRPPVNPKPYEVTCSVQPSAAVTYC